MAVFDAQLLSRSLIGGMTIEAFNSEVRERKAARFEAALDLEQLDALHSLSRLESLFKWEGIPMGNVDVFDDGQLRRLVDLQRKSGKSGLAVIADSFRRGSTIRVRDLDKFDARLHRFVEAVRRDFTAQAQINLYLTPPTKTGFPPHFDITDVFIVQCIGRKEWRIFNEYSGKTELPLMETDWDPDRFVPTAPAEAMALSPGDVLYLPRGAMHQAFCTERESMHLTISVVPLTFSELLAKALKRVAEEDIEFRRRVPWSLESGSGGLEAIVIQVKERIAALSANLDLDALLRAERRVFQEEPEAVQTGELESAIASLLDGAGQPARM
ncbi:MAG: cupin domain-containing protein [Vicinamibacterales bacterium]